MTLTPAEVSSLGNSFQSALKPTASTSASTILDTRSVSTVLAAARGSSATVLGEPPTLIGARGCLQPVIKTITVDKDGNVRLIDKDTKVAPPNTPENLFNKLQAACPDGFEVSRPNKPGMVIGIVRRKVLEAAIPAAIAPMKAKTTKQKIEKKPEKKRLTTAERAHVKIEAIFREFLEERGNVTLEIESSDGTNMKLQSHSSNDSINIDMDITNSSKPSWVCYSRDGTRHNVQALKYRILILRNNKGEIEYQLILSETSKGNGKTSTIPIVLKSMNSDPAVISASSVANLVSRITKIVEEELD